MMRIIVDVNEVLFFNDELESSFYTFERTKRFTNGCFVNTIFQRHKRGGNGIFHVMKTGDAELNLLDFFSKTVKIKFKKPAFGSNVFGKKLSLAHTIRLFQNVSSFSQQGNRFMNNQI